MSIEKAIAQIDAGEQSIPSSPLANTGLSDLATWYEVREWLATLADEDDEPTFADRMAQRSLDAVRHESWKSKQ